MPLQDKSSLDYFKRYLECVNWDIVLNDNSTAAFVSFDKIISDANQICCPTIRKVLSNSPIEPWFSKSMLRSRATKEKLYKKAKSSGDTVKWQFYKRFCNVYNRVIRASKLKYYTTEFSKSQ
jgi:hypothetical protein